MNKHYHFIGIGGIGMGALAILLLKKGYQVSGSDVRENQMVLNLREQGARISIGHARENLNGADCVVFSSAIAKDNPELIEAQTRNLKILQRAQLLADLMQGHTGITVAGAHGKTTTTSMISNMLIKAGLQPTTAIGGVVTSGSLGYQASLGKGTYFVAETDESDGSFLKFSPKFSVITNIDFEHVDYFHSLDNIIKAYGQFIRSTAADGFLVACGDDENLSKLLPQSPCPVRTYGFEAGNDIVAQNISFDGCSTEFDCLLNGKSLGKIRLQVPGKHNVANAMACIGLGLHLSIDIDIIRRSLWEYTSVQRRFQFKNKTGDVWVVDDYAHHPTEIQATLAAAQQLQRKRIITIFQPHRYTRVKFLWEEMVKSFTHSDYLILTDIYAASEQPIDGITSQRLIERIKQEKSFPAVYLQKQAVLRHVLDMIQPGDLVMVLGAGDITYLSDEIARAVSGNKKVDRIDMNNDIKEFGRIGVLMGGYSSERDISLKSGKAIAEALKRQGAEVIPIDIIVKDREKIAALLRSHNLDIAFIALHGRLGEDGVIQSILESIDVPYTGSGVAASRLALDKVTAQDLFTKSGIQVAKHMSLSRPAAIQNTRVGTTGSYHFKDETKADLSVDPELYRKIDFYPVVVKPAREGSSIGISLVPEPEALAEALQNAWKYDDKVLIEQYIGGRELTVGILGEQALPPIEICPQAKFFDFTAKYNSAGATEYVIPAKIPEELSAAIRATALEAHRLLGCSDLSRVDFILAENGSYYVLEVNTIPGFTATSLLPKAAQVIGINFDELCLQLIKLAHGKKKKVKNSL